MSRTGVDSLDRSIDKTNVWLADVAANFGTEDRRLAYRVTRSWLHTLRDRLPVPIAAHIAAQLPELLRGVFYEGWNPSKVPVKYGKDEYIARFAKDAQIHQTEVPRAGRLVTAAFSKHLSPGAVNEAFGALPAEIRRLVAAPDGAAGEDASGNGTARNGTAERKHQAETAETTAETNSRNGPGGPGGPR